MSRHEPPRHRHGHGPRQLDRFEAHKARMRGRVIVMALAIGALAAVLVAGLTMLAKSQ